MARVGAVGLGSLLVAAPRRGLGRLGEMDIGADRAQLLHHETPPRRRLQRRRDLPPGEPRREPPDVISVRGRHAGAADLTGLGVQPLGGDLSPMLIQSHYDRPTGPPQAPRLANCAHHARLS
jgi:hypothetical protein